MKLSLTHGGVTAASSSKADIQGLAVRSGPMAEPGRIRTGCFAVSNDDKQRFERSNFELVDGRSLWRIRF